ncbi:MAG: L,D-transpeptidase [Hyphomicrobiaceae bacterium]
MIGFRPLAITCVAFCLVVAAAAFPASAQSWFGGSYGDNSVDDRFEVTFPTTYRPGDIIVSFSDRRLYHVIGQGRAMSYPIAVPRPESRWQGVLNVSMKRENPDWTPTPRMRQENPELPITVPGGHPQNPLGVRALYLGSTLFRIHGTDAPWTIGKNVSKGCVRMHNEHVIELYNQVRIGARVTATWKEYKVAVVSGSGLVAGTDKSGADWERRVFGLN